MPESKIVRWDGVERRQVAVEAFNIAKREPKLTLRNLVSRAQIVLPTERQRPIGKTQDDKLAAWLMPLWDEMQDEINAQVKAAAAPLHAVKQSIAPLIGPHEAASHDRKMAVHWKETDKRTVMKKARELLLAFPDMKKIEALRKAMASDLPADRQRELTHWGMVSAWADPMLAQLEIEARLIELEQKRLDEAPSEPRRVEENLSDARLKQNGDSEQVRASEFEAAVSERVGALSFEALIRAFAAKLARETITAIGAEFEKQMAGKIIDAVANGTSARDTKPADDDKLIVPPNNRMPLVGVVGLLNQQSEDVRRAFLGTIDFVFVKSQQEGGNNGGGHAMLEKCSRCDVVIAMTDFMGHDVDRASKQLNVPFKRLTGSVSSLKRYLSSWINGEVALKTA